MEVMEADRPPREARREQILAAARTVLAEHGYERTTVSQIAAGAQVAQGTFYLYFPSKEALPGELALGLSRRMGDATARAARAETLPAALEALLEEVLACGQAAQDILLVANRGVELAPDSAEFSRLTAPWRTALEAFVLRFQATGEIDAALDAGTTAVVLRDWLDRTVKFRVLFGDEEVAAATATLVRRALSC